MSHRLDRHDRVGLGLLPMMEALYLGIIPHRQVRRFHKRPRQIRVPILGVPLAFAFSLTELGPGCRLGSESSRLLKNHFGTVATQHCRKAGTASEQPAGWSKRPSSAAVASEEAKAPRTLFGTSGLQAPREQRWWTLRLCSGHAFSTSC